MLGDAEEWFYRGLGGINVDLARKGAEQIVLRPAVLSQLAWVRTQYRSALGPIQSDWRRDASETAYDFTIPVNATAIITLSTASPREITVNGTPLAKARGILATRIDGNRVYITAGSGHYAIRAANPVALHTSR